MLTTLSECSQPRVGLLTKEPWRVHSSPPNCPPSTRARRDAPPSRFMSCRGGRGGGEGAVRRGGHSRRAGGGEEPVLLRSSLDGSAAGRRGLLDAQRPGSRVAETPRRREPILGKKEHSVVGLFSAGRGDDGGRMGVREEEEKEEGSPGEGVRGVEGGREEGLEFVSSVELRDSLRQKVYLVFGTSSIVRFSVKLQALELQSFLFLSGGV